MCERVQGEDAYTAVASAKMGEGGQDWASGNLGVANYTALKILGGQKLYRLL